MKQPFLFILFSSFLLVVACKEPVKTDEKSNEVPETNATNTGISGTYSIDPQSSTVKWKGIKPTGVHNGTVPVSGGSINVSGGMITGGTVEIDMTGITVLDLQGENKQKLEAHLKGRDPGKEEDFFNVDKYPKSTFVINSVSALNNDPD